LSRRRHAPRPILPGAVAALLAAAAGQARADGISELAGLLDEPVVSTASKAAETAQLAPATVSVVSGDDLRRFGIDSLADAINFLTTGMIAEPSFGTPEIGARGVLLTTDYGNHVLILLDGHPLNEPWDGAAYYDWSVGIPLDLVDHVEVILGPGSVLYGSNAMLGVINVITRRAQDYPGLHLGAEGSLPRAGHAFAGLGLPVGPGGEKGGLTVGLDYLRSSGPRERYDAQPYGGVDWGGVATHRQLEIPSALARLAAGDLVLAARAAASTRRATQIMGDFDDPGNFERDRWWSLEASWGRALGRSLHASARAYLDWYDYVAFEPWTASIDCLEGQERCAYRLLGRSRWAGAEVSATWDWLADGRLVTLLGAEARRIEVDSSVTYRDLDGGPDAVTSVFDRGGSVLAAYVQQTLNPASWLSVNAGVRLDRVSEVGSHLSPRVAAVVPTWPGGTVKGVYSEAFRAPSFYERFYGDHTNELQAEALRPEVVRSLEALVEQHLGAQRLRLSAFRSFWHDLVVQIPATDEQVTQAIARGQLVPDATGVTLYANAARVESYGLSADWEGSGLGRRLRYGASITAARSWLEGGGGRLPAAGGLFGNAHASWDLGAGLPTLALAVRGVSRRPVAGTDYSPPPTAPAQLEGLAAVSGPIAGGLSYRLAADRALTGRSPYAVGPTREPANGLGYQPVLPVPTWRAMLGLRYDR
jgi:outer membrane receptor for ferrienterochelin and colicins